MTVNELVQLLAAYPADLRVVVNGYEDGYDDLSPEQISLVKIALNTGTHDWEGKHGDPHNLTGGRPDDAEVIEALFGGCRTNEKLNKRKVATGDNNGSAAMEQDVNSEWREVTLGEFAPFTYGKSLPAGKRNPSGSVPVVGSNGIVDYHDSALTEGPTIVIGRKGTVGAVHYLPDPCWPIDTTFFVAGNDAALVRFKFYALSSLGLEQMNSDSAVPGLNRDAAHARELLVPDESEQRAIAHVLGTLDDKIKLNRRMNETLEEMARALFQSWFVDFEPVRAKLEGRWRRGESLPGLPAHLYDLFPDRLVDSELGEVPEGWGVGVLDDAIELLSGGTPKTSVSGFWGGGIPWYAAKDAPNGSNVFALDTERTITQLGVENSATRIIAAGTTVITARGTVGRLACLGVPMAMNQTCYGIRGAHGYPDFFTYWNVRAVVDELQTRTHGTIFDTITCQTFALVETALGRVCKL